MIERIEKVLQEGGELKGPDAEFDLYHPDVIESMPEWFGPAWFEYWGISQ